MQPIIVTFADGREIIVPAIVAKWYLKDWGSSYKSQFLNLATSVVLPEALIKPATLAKWGRWLKGGEAAKTGDWAKYVDDFFANSKVITSKNRILNKRLDKVYTQLSVEEITAIHHYTTGAYKDFNAALRAANGNIYALDEFNRAFYEILQSGMQKMPSKFSGQLYRGTSLSEQALLKYKNAFNNGSELVEYAYTSTSQKTNVIEFFQSLAKQEGEVNVVMQFNAKGIKAVDVNNISRYGPNFNELGGQLQDEVLFMSGAKFKVTGYEELTDAVSGKYIEITFTEIP